MRAPVADHQGDCRRAPQRVARGTLSLPRPARPADLEAQGESVVRSIDTLVVGGGQAGLASSHSLARRGVDHVVLEAGHVGESWRSRRWDSSTLVTPNWMTAPPDLPRGVGGTDHPNGFLPRAEIVEMLSSWATAIAAPVRDGIAVTSVIRDPAGPGFRVETTDGPWSARRVIAIGRSGASRGSRAWASGSRPPRSRTCSSAWPRTPHVSWSASWKWLRGHHVERG